MKTWMVIGLLFISACSSGDGDSDAPPAEPNAPPAPPPPPPPAILQDVVDPSLDPFDDNVLPTYALTMSGAEWNAMVANPFNNTWRRAMLDWRGETYHDVAVRPSGETSRVAHNPKPSLRLSFEEFSPGRRFHGLPSIKLDSLMEDPSMMRERLSYGVYNAQGIPAPRETHARLVVNGALKGLYAAEERLTRTFAQARFGDPVGQLYRWTDFRDDMRWEGSDPALYVPTMWEPRTESLPPDAEGVRDLVDVLNNAPQAAPSVFEVDRFMELMAVEVVTGEADGYIGINFNNVIYTANIYLYKTPGGKHMILPWDRGQSYYRVEESPILMGFDQRVLTKNLILDNPVNLARFHQLLRDTVAGPHATATLQARLDFIHDQIRAAAFEDPYKGIGNPDFTNEVLFLRGYIERRNNAVLQQAGP